MAITTDTKLRLGSSLVALSYALAGFAAYSILSTQPDINTRPGRHLLAGAPIESHQNPLGSVYTTVTRLVADGDVVPGEPRGQKKTYRWRGLTIPRSEETRQIVSALVFGKGLVKTTKKP